MSAANLVRCSAALLGVLALALAGCKKKSATPSESAADTESPAQAEPAEPLEPPQVNPAAAAQRRAELEALATTACACGAKPTCLAEVRAAREAWDAKPMHGLDLWNDEGLKATYLKISNCLAGELPPAAPAERTELPASYEGDVALARLLHDAKAYLAAAYPDVAIVTINAQYLRASGVVDPKYGVVILETGAPRNAPVDDPDRPTGAPVPEPEPTRGPPRTQCPFLKWTAGAWSEDLLSCRDRPPLVGPRCTADQIWQRAITDKAPDNAVAVLRIGMPYADRWAFSISDPLRKVSFNRTYRDDCEPASERE